MSDETKPPKEKKSRSWLYIAIGVLVVLIVLAGGYIFISNDDQQTALFENLGYVAQEEIDVVDAELVQCEADLSVVKVEVEGCDDAEEVTNVKNGTVNDKYMVTFEYPSTYFESLADSQANGGVVMYTTYDSDGDSYSEMVFSAIGRAPIFPDQEGGEEYKTIEINGQEYTVYMDSNGDAGLGSKSFTTTYYVELEEDLYLVGYSVNKKMMTECLEEATDKLPSCDDADVVTYYSYDTSMDELDVVMSVMESFTWESEEVKGVSDQISGEEEALVGGEDQDLYE